MNTSRLVLLLCVTSALAACAQQPVKGSSSIAAQAAHYGVSAKLLVAAENHDYWPQIRHDKTLFCRASDVTGSYIAQQECLDAAQLQTRLARETDEQQRDQRALQVSHAACPPNAAGC